MTAILPLCPTCDVAVRPRTAACPRCGTARPASERRSLIPTILVAGFFLLWALAAIYFNLFAPVSGDGDGMSGFPGVAG